MYEPEPTSDQFPFIPVEIQMQDYNPKTVRLYDKYGDVYEDILLSEYEDRFFNGWASEIKKWDLRLEKDIEDE